MGTQKRPLLDEAKGVVNARGALAAASPVRRDFHRPRAATTQLTAGLRCANSGSQWVGLLDEGLGQVNEAFR